MRFMISSSDRALARSDFRRFWPLLFGYAVVWLCALPLALWNKRTWAYDPKNMLATMDNLNDHLWGCTVAAPIVSACFAVLLAMALFAYLMNSRSTGLMHSLPITRGRQFAVHFTVGVLIFTAVHVAAALISLPVQAGYGVIDMRGTLEWLAVAELTSLFFFALASACAMVTGWLLAIPVIYAGINFMFAAFYLLFAFVAQLFIWGFEGSGWPTWIDCLTPVVRLFRKIRDGESTLVAGAEDGWYETHLSASGWTTLLVYTVVAVVLILITYLLYRARHSETAGDAIVFPWLRPIVLYVISLAGGIGLGILLWYLVSSAESIYVLLVCQIITGLIVYFGVQMLLHKSFKVFTRRGWLGAAALAVVLAVITLVVRFDVFGLGKYVPDADRIESVNVGTYYELPSVHDLSDPDGLEKLTALHRAILEQGPSSQAEIDQVANSTSGDAITLSIDLDYTMKDGSTFQRNYYQVVRRGTPLYEAYNAFFNEPSVRKASTETRYALMEIDPTTITGGWFNNYRQEDDSSIELSSAQARQLYLALARYLNVRQEREIDVIATQSASGERDCCFYLGIVYQDTSIVGTNDWASDTPHTWDVDLLPGDCTEVLDLLVSFGLAETTDELLYD